MAKIPIKKEVELKDFVLEDNTFQFYASYEVLFETTVDDEIKNTINLKIKSYYLTLINTIQWNQVYGPSVIFNNNYTSIDFINEDTTLVKIFKVDIYLNNGTVYSLNIEVFKDLQIAEGLQYDDSVYVLLDDGKYITVGD